uniref:Pentatricopeptide repeat-containing protein n=1 Tax=Tanacetum cinerariifolium TaxID=118510 RepID=A0A699HSZ4_TANCI|nr:hypothetical protein [Tanacetum cinerariifolium]
MFCPEIVGRGMSAYTTSQQLVNARNVFDEMREKDLCSENTMVFGYAKAGRVDDARTLSDEMVERFLDESRS